MVAQQTEVTPMARETLHMTMQDILKNTDLTDPHDIAKEMIKRIPKSQYHKVLVHLLANYVRGYASRDRRHGSIPPASALPKTFKTKHAGGIKSTSTSATVTAIREGWQRHLRDRIGVGTGEVKMLKDCTYDDLVYAAKRRQKAADDNKAWAARFNAYAALLTEFDVKTFGDLPVEVHLKVLGAA